MTFQSDERCSQGPTMTLIDEIERFQLMAAVRTDSPEKAYRAAEACVNGGFRFIEVTFSVPDAAEVIKKLKADGRVKVGAGTVLSVAEAREALRAGAEYIVSPVVNEEVVRFTKKEGALSIPGASTPSEIYRAYKTGGDIIKLFPFVEMGGLDFLRVIRGPFPFIRYMLCGGVTLENIERYLAARTSAILVGSAIFKRDLLAAEDWASIEEISRRFTRAVEEPAAKRP